MKKAGVRRYKKHATSTNAMEELSETNVLNRNLKITELLPNCSLVVKVFNGYTFTGFSSDIWPVTSNEKPTTNNNIISHEGMRISHFIYLQLQ